jgi:hypothetical protein
MDSIVPQLAARDQPIEHCLVGFSGATRQGVKRTTADAINLACIHTAKRPAIGQNYHDGAPRVSHLRGLRDPSAIPEFVVSVIINAIKFHARQVSRSHVVPKTLERLPFLAYADASGTIIFRSPVGRVGATSSLHGEPSLVGASAAHAVGAVPRRNAYIVLSHRIPLARCRGQDRGGRSKRSPGPFQFIRQSATKG